MNKTAIKNFAVGARRKLIASVKDKAGRIGITKDKVTEAISVGNGFAIFPTSIGIEARLAGRELRQRENLVRRISENGYESVMEEVAYTWFNRMIAIRFMEANDYLSSRVRVLSSEIEGKAEPDIVSKAPNVDLSFTDKEKEAILLLKEKNQMDELFRMLFIKQCNDLAEILPQLFESASEESTDYTEILFDISYTNEDSVLRDLLTVPEEDFLEAVEIIGWMYQYYNAELKDETFALLKKNVKITKDRLPAATQLFTPDWIVRYMVENSLGRLWLEGHPNEILRSEWKYYLDEAKQEPEVAAELEKIRREYAGLNPEDIKIIDPCMGSGHILVYAFDILMQIYESCGYTKRDAAKSILEHNLYGIDIDDRAYQLAYFAAMMKARKYNRRILSQETVVHVYSIKESNHINRAHLKYFGDGWSEPEKNAGLEQTTKLLDLFIDAKEYGSILEVKDFDWKLLSQFIGTVDLSAGDQISLEKVGIEETLGNLKRLCELAAVMSMKYDVVVTNPPYMGGSGMGAKLSEYVKKKFPDSKSDMFAVFIESCGKMRKQNRFQAMITQHAWMFLSSYEKLRKKMLTTNDIVNMAHLGPRAFEEIGGEVVQTTAFVTRSGKVVKSLGTYVRLIDINDAKGKEQSFLETACGRNHKLRFNADASNFEKIPGMPVAYWVSAAILELFKNKLISEVAKACIGMRTGDNERFLRLWFEVCDNKTAFQTKNSEKLSYISKKWVPYNKGGERRKWYGNQECVVNWENNGYEIKENTRLVYPQLGDNLGWKISNESLYCLKHMAWTDITTKGLSYRTFGNGFIFDASANVVFSNDENHNLVMAFLNSKVVDHISSLLNPTLHFKLNNFNSLPYIQPSRTNDINEKVCKNIDISRTDWDSFETSWDFKRHPLLEHGMSIRRGLVDYKYVHKAPPIHMKKRNRDFWYEDGQAMNAHIETSFKMWEDFAETQFNQLKANEEELNRIFIDIYGLQDELTPEVEDKDVTIRKAVLGRDIRSLISYAVGCMFGRYSLDVEGLAYASGDWDSTKYASFIPDKDNILPILDEEYFEDDIVARFVEFVKVVYGAGILEENLDFVAEALGNKGDTSRDIIRNYFLKDFYKDHLKIYQKRPIYWLFDSGKDNGFKALIYLHRYDRDTVGRVRTDYLHKTQAALESSINSCDIILDSQETAPNEKAKAVKRKEKLVKQLTETRLYDQAIAHIALQRIPLDLDDGVVVNYAKFQGVPVASEGKKTIAIDLLGKI